MAAPPPSVTYEQNNINSTSNSNMTINSTVVNAPPPAEAREPDLKGNMCCQQGQPWVCPNPPAYLYGCVQHPDQISRVCHIDNTQRRFCR